MTGHGDARHHANGIGVTVEIRTVNSRYFKLLVRGPETYASLESKIEEAVRRHIRRGTVSVALRIERDRSDDDFQINGEVLKSYRQQLADLSPLESPGVNDLLMLPGVVDEPRSTSADLEHDWPVIEPALRDALESLEQMRRSEGQATANDLASNSQSIFAELDRVENRSPDVVHNYQQRLTDRINKLLSDYDVSVQPSDVIREVGVFSERCDISEEIVRLRSHLVQFERISGEEESAGRKLEFLIQEMFRETNTIGSKANDAEIAMYVVEIKTCIERMREQIQNVE